MLTQVPLPRTTHLAAEQWAAIDDAYARLAGAVAAGDRPLIVGSAKELTECVARVVLDARGRATADNADYTKVISGAHQVVEHATGADMPANDPLRQIPDAAKKMAVQLGQLRNRFGTGHGRAILHPVTDEVIEASVHACLVWVRWVLARLDTVLLGAVVPLVRDLGGSIFYGGDLAQRLAAAHLADLEEGDQRSLGLAVGRRAAHETYNVRIEGIDVCAVDPGAWPDAYREGVVQGVFLNEDGQLDAHPAISASSAAIALVNHSSPEHVLAGLRSLLASASWSPAFAYTHDAVLASMHDVTSQLPAGARRAWTDIINDLHADAEP